MNRWGALSKCRNDSTVGIHSDTPLRPQQPASASALASASSSPNHTSYPYSRLDFRQHRAKKSHGVSLLASTLFCLVILLCFCSPCVNAAAISDNQEEQASQALTSSESILLFDRSTPPEPLVHLIRRAERSTSTSSSASSISTATSGSSDALPRPFDTGLGNNFTTSTCPTFFKNFLSDEAFNECIPLSLLLQTSTSFFSVQRSPVRLAQTLSASCSVNFDTCSTLMASLARQIQSPNNCAADLQNQNPMAMQAYDGFVAYQSLYHAGCLLNSDTGAYCFSDAVTNATSPTDSYVYYLPLGVSLPGTTAPSCSECLRDTMSAFASAATNRSQPVSYVYASAAAMIDVTCGADFVNASIPRPHPTSAAASFPSPGLKGLGSIALLVSLLTVLM